MHIVAMAVDACFYTYFPTDRRVSHVEGVILGAGDGERCDPFCKRNDIVDNKDCSRRIADDIRRYRKAIREVTKAH